MLGSSHVCRHISIDLVLSKLLGAPPYLRESAIIPQIAVVGEAISDKSQLALLDILLDRIELLLFRDLEQRNVVSLDV